MSLAQACESRGISCFKVAVAASGGECFCVWTGLSIIFLLLIAVASHLLSIVNLRKLSTETVYAALFAFEHHFLSYSMDVDTSKS